MPPTNHRVNNEASEGLPEVPEDLLLYLKQTFPVDHSSLKRETSFDFIKGVAEVISHLEFLRNQAEEDRTEGTYFSP